MFSSSFFFFVVALRRECEADFEFFDWTWTDRFLSTFVTGFVVAFVRNWRLALVVSTIVPAIAIAGALMNKYMSEYRRLMLEQTAEGGTLVEEVVSSVRNAHAFGTQRKLAGMYDVGNVKVSLRSECQ